MEGSPTVLAGFIPKVLIVPFESGYPGYGRVHLLNDADHIGVCKPKSREDVAYKDLLEFIKQTLGLEERGGGCVVSDEGGDDGLPTCG